MTHSYPTVPLAWLDGLHDLNTSLEVYHQMMSAWAQQALNGDVAGDPRTFIAGLDLMFKPILDGYRDIHSQIQSAKDLGHQTSTFVEASQ